MAALPSFDQFLNLDQFDQSSSASTSTNAPVFVEQDANSAGINYSDLFRDLLGAETKSPSFSLPPLPSHPFALSAPENDNPSTSSGSTSFSPDVFSPSAFHVPGSPIGGFSPSSDNSGSNSRSPISFGDELDFDTTGDDLSMNLGSGNGAGDDWRAIDPSFFNNDLLASTTTGLEGITSEPPSQPSTVVDTVNATSCEEPDIIIKSEPVLITIPEASHEDEEMNEDEDDDEDSDSDREIGGSRTRRASSSLSGSGKKSKRPTKVAKTSVAAFASATLHPTSAKSTLPPVPEWNDKPDPETYKKLNSKEKRQLRNKISARNFRHRRKEYITTLEEEISSRDTIIAELRDEVGTMKVENKDLRSEVSLLKHKWDEMMEKMTSFSAPPVNSTSALGLNVAANSKIFSSSSSGSGTSSSASSSNEEWALDSPKLAHATLPTNASVNLPQAPVASGSGVGTRRSAKKDIVKPNLSKDVAPSLKRGTGSWATQGMGGYTSVHTTILPEFNFLNAKPTLPPFSTGASFNPTINALTAAQRAELPSLTSHLRTPFQANDQPQQSRGTFDQQNFFDSNPLWLRPENIEEYRGQLYGKVAHNLAGLSAAQKQAPSSSSSSSPNGSSQLPLPAGFRPAFFTSPRSASQSLYNGGKEKEAFYNGAPASSDLLAFQSPSRAAEEQQRFKTNALVAGLATQTLFSRMAGAFVDAFAGNEAGAKGMMSSEKVASVLSGKSRLRVVPNDDVNGLGALMGDLDLSAPTPVVARPQTPGSQACSFEDVMQRWSSGKKEGGRPGTPTS